jgi:hypothetical protein
MHQTKKGNQWYFGMKAHFGVDSRTKLIHAVVATPANVADSTVLPDLLHGKETRVWGDQAYRGQRAVIRQHAPKAQDFVNRRYRHRRVVDQEAANVRVKNVVHLLARDPDDKRVKRIVLAALWSEPVREPEEVLLIDPVEHHERCSLDNLAFEGGDRERALPAIGLRYVPTPGRQSPVCSSLDPLTQIVEVALEICLVIPPGQPIHAGRRVALEREEGLPEQAWTDVVEERVEPFALPFPCDFLYAVQRS